MYSDLQCRMASNTRSIEEDFQRGSTSRGGNSRGGSPREGSSLDSGKKGGNHEAAAAAIVAVAATPHRPPGRRPRTQPSASANPSNNGLPISSAFSKTSKVPSCN